MALGLGGGIEDATRASRSQSSRSSWCLSFQDRFRQGSLCWEGNEYQLTSGVEYFTEPYTGWYMVYVNLFADWDRDGEYDYVTYFYIDEIILEEP